MIGCLRTRVRKQPIIALYFESELVLKFYNLEARLYKTFHFKTITKLIIPTLFFNKSEGDIESPPSVRPLCYFLLNRWTKSNQIWCVSYSHDWGMQQQIFLPHPLGPWGAMKRSNIITFQSQSKFQRFLYQTLCAPTNERYKRKSNGIYILSPVSCLRGGTLGRWATQGVSKSNMVMLHIELAVMTSGTECK